MWWHWLVGYAFSAGAGLLFITLLNTRLYQALGWEKGKQGDELHPHRYHPAMVGVAERTLYTAAWQLGKPEFIGVWLVFKVAGQWGGWTNDRSIDGKKVLGRAVYNVFMIGNAFSLAYAVAGAMIPGWLADQQYLLAILIPLAVMLATLAFTAWASGKTAAA